MSSPANLGKCAPLMEACTLDLYKKNIFRVTGLPVDATSKEVSRQAQKIQMLAEMGGGAACPLPAFSLSVAPTPDEIRSALARMKEPEHRIVDEFFWYWPEEFGASNADPAIQKMLAGDTESAVRLWRDREKGGSHVAQHNMAIMYHMFAVDWTNYHVSYDIDRKLDGQIKGYWRKSFERWEALIDRDEIWEILKARIRSFEDEALTTGFVRRMLKQLPSALDRVNAEAALRMAEQGRLDWARFHVEFMNETHQGLDDVESTSEMVLEPTKIRVNQYLASFVLQSDKTPAMGAELALQLLDYCRPMMGLFDLFHGATAHQRNDLFDKVAETVLQMVVSHQRSTGDNKTFVTLLQNALEFASGTHVRERIINNITIGEGNLKFDILKPILLEIEEIGECAKSPAEKLAIIKKTILPKIPELSSRVGIGSNACIEVKNMLAHVLRSISIDAHNKQKDYATAESSIQLALKLAVDGELKNRINSDIRTLSDNKKNTLCFYCHSEQIDETSSYQLPMYGEVYRQYRTTHFKKIEIPIQRCRACKNKHDTARNWGWFTMIALCSVGLIGGPIGVGVGLLIGWIISNSVKSNGPQNVTDHPSVKEMRAKSWCIGEKP